MSLFVSVRADRRTRMRTTTCGAIGLGMLAVPAILFAQVPGEGSDTQQVESLQAIEASGNSQALQTEMLAPLVVQGQVVNSADAPTTGYSADATRGATKTDTPLIQTPQAIDIVTRAQIEDQGADSINEALRYTPGVFTGLAGSSARQTVVSLRGFPGGDVNNTFMDGLRLGNDPGTYSNFLIDPFFLARIDVVKGATSALYGRAQPGGLVNYVTKKPLAEQRRLLRLHGGSFDTYGAGIDLTGPLPDASLGEYRVTASFERSGTQHDIVSRERYTIMPQVRLHLSEDTSLLLQAYLQHEPEGGFHGSVPYDLSVSNERFGATVGPDWFDGSADYGAFERDTGLFAYQLRHEVNDNVTLTSKGRYGHVDTYLEQVYQNGFTAASTPSDPELARYFSRADESLDAFSFDNNAEIEFDTGAIEHRLLVGIGYQQRDNSVRYATGYLATPLDPFNPDYHGDPLLGDDSFAPTNERQIRQFGFYVQDQMRWNRWHLALNARQDYLEREYVNGATGDRDERSDNAFTTRAALLYESRWGLSPYVSYSEGFNMSAYTPYNGNVAEPVESHQYEAGLKYQPLGIDALFTLAVYDLTQENVQQRFAVSPPRFVGVGDVESQGIEFSVRADLTERLHLLAAYTNSSVEYASNFPANGIVAGNTFTRTPDEFASLWLKYRLTPGIDVGAGVRYVGESFANSENTLVVPDYTLADAFVSVELGDYFDKLDGASLRVNATNIFNKEYVAACYSELNCYYGQPRTVTATLNYQF